MSTSKYTQSTVITEQIGKYIILIPSHKLYREDMELVEQVIYSFFCTASHVSTLRGNIFILGNCLCIVFFYQNFEVNVLSSLSPSTTLQIK